MSQIKKTKDRYGQTVYGYDARINGRRYRKTGFGTESAALVALSKLRIKAIEKDSGVPQDSPRVTVAEVLNDRIKRLPVHKDARGHGSRLQTVRDLERFRDMLPSGLLMTELKTAHIAEYVDQRLNGRTPDTVRREVTNIMATIRKAWQRFPSLESWAPPQKPAIEHAGGSRKGRQAVYEPNALQNILAELRRPKGEKEQPGAYRARLDAADAFLLALYTASRAGEVRTLQWSAILWDSCRIRIDDRKQAAEDLTVVPPEAIEILRERRERQNPRSRWIFPSTWDPERPIRALNITPIRKAARKLGIEWGYKHRNGVVFHTLRHTATSMMLDAGHDFATVRAQTRHSDAVMTARYAHPRNESRRAAADTLARIVKPAPQTAQVNGRFRGVTQLPDGKFRAQIKVNNKDRYISTHTTAEEAARAYDEAAILHHGQRAVTNFPRPKVSVLASTSSADNTNNGNNKKTDKGKVTRKNGRKR